MITGTNIKETEEASVVMPLNDRLEGALASQELRTAFFEDRWTDVEYTDDLERLIQPATFDEVTEDACWRVPNGFKPEAGASVLESIRRLSPRLRHEYNLASGVVIAPGFSYCMPLAGNWNIPTPFFMNASPKSTEGRMGNLVRLIADGIPKFDQVKGPFKGKMYVVVKPLAFHQLVFPGFPFTQLRAYCRRQCVLSDDELARVIAQQQLVKRAGVPVPVEQLEFDSGLLLTADLEGGESEGVIGFRARKNPDPVDRRRIRDVDWEHYWDPLLVPRSGQINLHLGEFLLSQSWEWVEMTDTLAGIMADYRTRIMDNKVHNAGYFDARRFQGVATLEIPVTDEVPLRHREPVCAIQFEHVRVIPDKEYRGTHHGQKFALLPRHFKLPDPADIAGKVSHEHELVIYADRSKVFGSDYFEGFSPRDRVNFKGRLLRHGQFAKKGSAEVGTGLEADTSKKQPIPYVVFVNPREQSVFVYQRSRHPDQYSEQRLAGKRSFGVGGHVRVIDSRNCGKDTIEACLERESEEEVEIVGTAEPPVLLGYLNDDTSTAVDAVHFGLLYVQVVDGIVRPKDAELGGGAMMPIQELGRVLNDPGASVERWTQLGFEPVGRFLEDYRKRQTLPTEVKR